MSLSRVLLCPTLDIDLCWHTHMLLRRYTRDTVHYVGRFVNHDDKIEEEVLSNAFEDTAKRWKQYFNQNYSECGCVHNKPKARQILAQALTSKGEGGLFTKMKAASEKPRDLDEGSFDDATHPSTHNGVAVSGSVWDQRRRSRKAKSDEQIKRGKRRADHSDPFIAGYGYTGLYPFYFPPPIFAGGAACAGGSACASGGGGSCGKSSNRMRQTLRSTLGRRRL